MENAIRIEYNGASAEINLHGAELTSYKDVDGREYIWQGDPSVWAEHAPILFPVCGKAKNDQILINGTAYPMPKHGFACKSDFRVFETGDNFVDLILESSPETKRMYPFDFMLHVIYHISDHAFTTCFRIENHGYAVMPFCIGGHPGLNFPFSDDPERLTRLEFNAPISDQLDIVIAGGYIQGKESFAELQCGRFVGLTHAMIEQRDTLLFGNIACDSVSLISPDKDHILTMDFAGFPNLAIWTMAGKNAEYICLEPWIGLPASPDESGELAEKPFAVSLPAGLSYEATFTVSLK